jgi:hypothetical protein
VELQDDSGTEIPVFEPHSSYLKALIWAVPSVLLVLVGCGICVVLCVVLPPAIGLVFGLSLVAAGTGSFRMASRQVGRSARKILEAAQVRPVLLLRSFSQDGLRHEMRSTDYILHPVQYRLAPTFEERVVKHMSVVGPVVAVGKPGEKLPHTGAYRVYVENEHWQSFVDDLIQKASFVLIQSGDTAGLHWEIERAITALKPNQLLIFMPSQMRVSGRKRRVAYEQFRSWASERFPLGLPDKAKNSTFICFETDPPWAPRLLQWRP